MHKEKIVRDLIGLVYQEAVSTTCWPTFLARLAEFLDGDAGCLSTHDFRSDAGAILSAAGISPEFVQSYGSSYASLNPWLKEERYYHLPGTIVTGRQVVGHRELVETEFYNGWLRPQGYFHRIAGVLSRANDRLAYVEVLRPQAGGCFGRRELTLFHRLLPHLQQAFQVHRVASRLQAERDAAVEVLDRLPLGVLLVDRACQLLAANSYAKQLLAEADGLTLGYNGLCAASHEETASLRELASCDPLTATGGSARPDGALTLSRPSGRRPLQVLVSPLPRTGGLIDDEGPATVLFVADPDRAVRADQETLRRLFGLTRTEARLAALIAQGERLDEAAEAMGVSVGTARTHLKRIFSKTGAKRQSELVRLLLTGPACVRAD